MLDGRTASLNRVEFRNDTGNLYGGSHIAQPTMQHRAATAASGTGMYLLAFVRSYRSIPFRVAHFCQSAGSASILI